jgi:hypothetical protein
MPAPGRDYRFDGEIFEVVAEIFPDHALTKASELLDEALISAFAEGKEMPRFLNFLVDGKFIKQICIWDALPVPKLTKIAPLVDVRLRHRVFQCECPYCGKIHKHGAEGGGGHREAHCLDASDSPGALMV